MKTDLPNTAQGTRAYVTEREVDGRGVVVAPRVLPQFAQPSRVKMRLKFVRGAVR
jgi:hypothetical protein